MGTAWHLLPVFAGVSARARRGSEDRATLARFPLAVAALSATQRVTVAISYSTLLDRTWETNSSLLVGTGDDTSTATATFRSTGAINDVRLAAAYELRPTLRLGLGIHALSGENRTERALAASDSSAFSSTREQQAFSFSGKGLSAGLDWRPSRSLAIAASGRIGGTLTAWRGDTAVRRADVPTRAGASVAYNGFGGSLLVARADWEGWSRLRGLSSSAVETRDAWELSVGTETRGPSWFGTNLPLRGGVHWRTLPFALPGTGDVREVTGALGAGLPLARGRAQADFTVERAFRSFSGNAPGNASGGASDVRERAWTLSFGFGVRL